jgi:hypothetical protein
MSDRYQFKNFFDLQQKPTHPNGLIMAQVLDFSTVVSLSSLVEFITAGFLREFILQRYVRCCSLVRGLLLINGQNQSINIQDLYSGAKGRFGY